MIYRQLVRALRTQIYNEAHVNTQMAEEVSKNCPAHCVNFSAIPESKAHAPRASRKRGCGGCDGNES